MMDKEIYEKIKDSLPEQLRKDVEKYGSDNFEFEILDVAYNQEELDRKHKEHIRKANSLEPRGYNIPEELE